MGTFETSARRGYRGVWELIKDYFYGWWLQFSRTLIFGAWLLVAGVAAGLGSIALSELGLLLGFLTFLLAPVVLGYINPGKSNIPFGSAERFPPSNDENPGVPREND